MESPKRKSKVSYARDYIEEYKDFPRKAIARALFKNHPELFKDVEEARFAVRRVLGKAGQKSTDGKRYSLNKKFWSEEYASRIIFPEGEMNDPEPFIIPPNISNLLVVSDFQVPFHDKVAMEIAFEHGYAKGCKGILLNGDQHDFYGISSFGPDITKRRVDEELDMMREILAEIRKWFPDIPIYWKDGNHEERLERYLRSYAPALLNVPEFQLNVLLRFGEHKIQYITKKKIIKFGKLGIVHGHELGNTRSVPVNPARWLFTRTKSNTMCGHFHQISEHIDKNLEGNIIGCWSTGCLCDLSPEWRPVNQWGHGFARVIRDSDNGNFIVKNKKIRKGRVM